MNKLWKPMLDLCMFDVCKVLFYDWIAADIKGRFWVWFGRLSIVERQLPLVRWGGGLGWWGLRRHFGHWALICSHFRVNIAVPKTLPPRVFNILFVLLTKTPARVYELLTVTEVIFLNGIVFWCNNMVGFLETSSNTIHMILGMFLPQSKK